MARKEELLRRLDEIGDSLGASGHALALLGLGSVGVEQARIDDYSDLDFFVIVQPGYKQAYITNLDWLRSIQPVAYHFQNTQDGHKLLFEDDIFCEFAVFEPDELSNIPFSEGRIVWKAEGFDEAICSPVKLPGAKRLDVEWQLGEALTNLYVGLGRYHRGEKLTAARFVQVYALDRLLELSALVERESPAFRDPFMMERRYEKRFPVTARELGRFMQGYERTRESAKAIVEFLAQHFPVNPHMSRAILRLCEVDNKDQTGRHRNELK